MRLLQCGFCGEGRTDYDFLRRVGERVVDALVLAKSDQTVEIAFHDVMPGGRPGNAPSDVVAAVKADFDYLDLLLYHTDAAGNVQVANTTRVDPVRAGLTGLVPVVGMVPKREMEAWAIADVNALCRVLGLSLSTVTVPHEFRPTRVESLGDPKAALVEFVAKVPTRGVRSSDPNLRLLGALAYEVDLDLLGSVPQFRTFRQETEHALRSLGVLT